MLDKLMQHGIGVGGGGNIKSIQHGRYVMSPSDTVANVHIDSVDASRAVVIASNIGWFKRGDLGFFIAEIIDSNTIRFSRGGGQGAPSISYTVIEFEDVNIQRGTFGKHFQQGSGHSAKETISISSVDLSKSILIASFKSTVMAQPVYLMERGFVNNQAIFFEFSTDVEQHCTIHWQVVEFKG